MNWNKCYALAISIYLVGLALAVIGVVIVPACATTQSLLIKADQAYATSVFALDDAEYAACHPVVALSAAACADLDGKVAQALQDVQATTRAVQLFPTTVPKDLPALLADLNNIQIILTQQPTLPLVADLSAKVANANAKAIDLLNHLLGVK